MESDFCFVVRDSIRMINNISIAPRTMPTSSPSGFSIEFRNAGLCLSITWRKRIWLRRYQEILPPD